MAIFPSLMHLMTFLLLLPLLSLPQLMSPYTLSFKERNMILAMPPLLKRTSMTATIVTTSPVIAMMIAISNMTLMNTIMKAVQMKERIILRKYKECPMMPMSQVEVMKTKWRVKKPEWRKLQAMIVMMSLKIAV